MASRGSAYALLIFWYLGAFGGALYATPVEKGYQASAFAQCECQYGVFQGESASKRRYRKMEIIGSECRAVDHLIVCQDGVGRLDCPSECARLEVSPESSVDNLDHGLSEAIKRARKEYQRSVPKSILQTLSKRYPNWFPLLVDSKPLPGYLVHHYLLNLDFYLESVITINGKATEIGILFFYSDRSALETGAMTWSFWRKDSAELLHAAETPYKMWEPGASYHPCIVAISKDPLRSVLYGKVLGASDAGGCCGPYDLGSLPKAGPSLMEGSSGPQGSSSPGLSLYEGCQIKGFDELGSSASF